MKFAGRSAAALCAAAALSTGAMPAAAQTSGLTGGAADIRKLDIMLMVTSLRCRGGAHDFQADYNQFASKHLKKLNQASDQLRRSLAARHGAKGSKRALDRIGVSMANTYGDGHPWMDCAQLKQATRELGAAPDSAKLYEAAKRLLAPRPAAEARPEIAQDGSQVTPRSDRIPYDLPVKTPLVARRED